MPRQLASIRSSARKRRFPFDPESLRPLRIVITLIDNLPRLIASITAPAYDAAIPL